MLTLFRRNSDRQADWYRTAHCLRRLGYHSAAVFSMRTAIERQLHRLAQQHPSFIHSPRSERGTIEQLAVWLMDRGLLSREHKRLFQRFAQRVNPVAHGRLIDGNESLRLLREAKSLRRIVDGALQSVLSR